VLLVAALSWAAAAAAAPTLGFIEDWPGTSTSSWGLTGGSATSNPGTGGVGGVGDGFLLVSNQIAAPLGTFSSGSEYVGDWVAAGITHVIVFLNDVGNADPLEIHFSIGVEAAVGRNFWQYNVGFIPPLHAWREFDVNLTSAANFTQIHGTGTFASALTAVDRIHLRHDPNPPAINIQPDPIAADFGIDRLVLSNVPAGVTPGSRVATARPVQLARPWPNPSRGGVELALEAFESGPVHLRGRMVPPGSYRARAWGGSGGTSRPLVRIR